MRHNRHSLARAWIAAFAATALVLQALLLSLTPPGARAAAAIEKLSAVALCSGSAAGGENPAAPAAPHIHSANDCCILCAVPGLAAGPARTVSPAPVWLRSFVVMAGRGGAIRLAQPFERSPVRPRAPPA